MQIRGTGMVATSLRPYLHHHGDTFAFACGVAQSAPLGHEAYDREITLLHQALEHCRNEKLRFVYFSSGGTIYGPTPAVRDETTPLAPQSPYGQHKQRCEEIICESGVRYLIVRLANLVGSNQNPAQLLPALIQQVMNGHVRVQRFAHRDLLDVTDFASILDRLLAVTEFSDTVVLASGQSIAVPRLVETIQTILNVSAKIEVVDSGEPQQFSIDRLRSYLPNISFETDYPYRVIQRTISRQYGETLEHLP